MKIRPLSSMDSQFGMQAWFSQRALLPPRLPSITDPSDRPNRKSMAFYAFALVAANGIAPRRDFTLVLKHALARRERFHCEHAPAVN
jgi:hypothetical protein